MAGRRSPMPRRDMPSYFNTEESRQRLIETEEAVIKHVKNVWGDFFSFVASENVLQVAVGLIVAKAFTDVVNALVSDIILPPISLLPFIGKNFGEKFLVLKPGPHYNSTIIGGYNTLQQAAQDGAVTWAFGSFIDTTVNFFVLGFALYAVARIYTMFTHDPIIKHTVRCKYCRKFVSEKATRCFNCTSWLDGREDLPTSALAKTTPVGIGGYDASSSSP